ncbi:MAG: hypothetical protein RR525_12025 [Cellulosilyticaceae bacterium]
MENYNINNIEAIVKQVMANLQGTASVASPVNGVPKSGRLAYLVAKQQIV